MESKLFFSGLCAAYFFYDVACLHLGGKKTWARLTQTDHKLHLTLILNEIIFFVSFLTEWIKCIVLLDIGNVRSYDT